MRQKGSFWVVKAILAITLMAPGLLVQAQDGTIRLLVRADDMGASRSANIAAIQAYEQGIVRSVEVMVPCAWFEEAATLLNERPDLDVGVHLTLTSEWSRVKWRPLTDCPSITDEDGYFLPFVWKNEALPDSKSIIECDWDIAEIETELRAQIELALKRMPHISHLSEHMGCLRFAPEARELYYRLANEYGLALKDDAVLPFPRWSGNTISATEKTRNLLEQIEQLQPGTYLLVEHPAYDDLETQGMGHVGYENVAEDRAGVLEAFTQKEVAKRIEERGIRLISYRDIASNK